MFAVGGAGFALGSLVLARALPADGFAVVALVLALLQFGITCGPFGLEVVVNRYRPAPDGRLAKRAVLSGGVFGVAMALVANIYYQLSPADTGWLLLAVVAGTVNRIVVALFQADRRVLIAMTLTQIHNYVLLGAALLTLLCPQVSATDVVAIIACGYVASTLIGGGLYLRGPQDAARLTVDARVALHEGIVVVGIGVAVQVLTQFERLAIPKLASMADLATYAALASIAGAPFRALQLGVTYTLLPQLRAAPDAAAARHALWREGAIVATLALGSSLAAFALAPWVFHSFLHDKYPVGPGLIGAAVLVGLARVWEGFSTTSVSALGSARNMAHVSVLGWVCLALAAGGTGFGSAYGLTGIVLGTAFAWIVLSAGGTWIARRGFRARFAASAGTVVS